MFESILTQVRNKVPLVHFITNYVTVNDCANVMLACGGSPIMADDIAEVEDITSICNALVLNIGTLNQRTIQSMIKAGQKANALSHPVVLDPVGAGASSLRTETTFRLLKEINFSVIRGNSSEMKTVDAGSGTTKGVDADISDLITEDTLADSVIFAKSLARKTGSIIAITGAIDIVSDANTTYIISNGHPIMSKITGTGCMLTGMIAAYCAANPDCMLEATAAAVCVMGLSGELAYQKMTKHQSGTGSFRTYLIDAISQMDASLLKEGQKVEIR